jgi:hypothetical protein
MEDEDFRTMELNGSHLKVFRDGRIHSFDNLKNKWTNRKKQLTNCGYYQLLIRKKPFFVHSVVTLCYLGIQPDGFETDHINNSTTDNRLFILQYLRRLDNKRKDVYATDNRLKDIVKEGLNMKQKLNI